MCERIERLLYQEEEYEKEYGIYQQERELQRQEQYSKTLWKPLPQNEFEIKGVPDDISRHIIWNYLYDPIYHLNTLIELCVIFSDDVSDCAMDDAIELIVDYNLTEETSLNKELITRAKKDVLGFISAFDAYENLSKIYDYDVMDCPRSFITYILRYKCHA
jgi:hypothetical protein